MRSYDYLTCLKGIMWIKSVGPGFHLLQFDLSVHKYHQIFFKHFKSLPLHFSLQQFCILHFYSCAGTICKGCTIQISICFPRFIHEKHDCFPFQTLENAGSG